LKALEGMGLLCWGRNVFMQGTGCRAVKFVGHISGFSVMRLYFGGNSSQWNYLNYLNCYSSVPNFIASVASDLLGLKQSALRYRMSTESILGGFCQCLIDITRIRTNSYLMAPPIPLVASPSPWSRSEIPGQRFNNRNLLPNYPLPRTQQNCQK